MHNLTASSLLRIGGSRPLLHIRGLGGTTRYFTAITCPSPLPIPSSSSLASPSSSSQFRPPFFPSATAYPAAWFMPPPPPPSPAPTALVEETAFARLAARPLARQPRMTVKESEVQIEEELSLGDFVAQVTEEEKKGGKGGEKKVCTKGCPTCSKRK